MLLNFCIVKGNDYVYKCVFGRDVMYLELHTTQFLNDQLYLLNLLFRTLLTFSLAE